MKEKTYEDAIGEIKSFLSAYKSMMGPMGKTILVEQLIEVLDEMNIPSPSSGDGSKEV